MINHIGVHIREILLVRIKGHKSSAKCGSKKIFHRAIRKYGIEAFTWQIIDRHGNYEYARDVLEPHYIKYYNSHYKKGFGYNMTDGGEGSAGRKMTDREKDILSKRWSGRKNPMYGTCRKGDMNPFYGKRHKESIKKKMKLSKIGYVPKSDWNIGRIPWNKGKTGKENKQSKIYRIIEPGGQENIAVGLRSYCLLHNLSYGNLKRSLYINQPLVKGLYKGWQVIEKDDNNENRCRTSSERC